MDQFYLDHKDLRPHKKMVGALVTEISAENPEMEVPEVLKLAAKRARTALGLKAGVKPK